MLKRIYLKNFKCYREADIECKPITVFCGGNSSGKTAILKSLLMLKQSFQATGNNYLLLNGLYTENGDFRELVHHPFVPVSGSDEPAICQNTESDDKKIRIRISFSLPNDTNGNWSELRKSLKNTVLREFWDGEITADFLFSKNNDAPQVGNVQESNLRFSCKYNRLSPLLTPNFQEPEQDEAELSVRLERRSESRYDLRLKGFPRRLPKSGKSHGIEGFLLDYQRRFNRSRSFDEFSVTDCGCYFNGMQLVSLFKDKLNGEEIKVLPIIYSLYRTLTAELRKVNYLGPLREAPRRQYLNQDIYTGVGLRGETAAQFLALQGGTTYRDIPLPGGGSPSKPIALSKAVARWATALDIGQVNAVTHQFPGAVITQIQVDQANLVDVGFGVSQALPILIEGLVLPVGSTLILEQPEIHLHPRMQMDITDFLIALYRSGRNLIIETHSDHIINRLVHRALENEALRNDIRIYYVERDFSSESHLDEVPIYEDGIREAPPGFFDQFASETQFIFEAAMENLRRKRERE